MFWFEISGYYIINRNYNPWSEDNGTVWDLK